MFFSSFPPHTGMQHKVIYGGEPWGLSLQHIILPEIIKTEYVTKMIGKWHLGHFKKDYLPESRG